MAVTPGTVLAGRYRVESVLAVGSMGTVYVAVDQRTPGTRRALKELLEHWGTAEERAEAELWFHREGETLRALSHPAIPRIYDTFSNGSRHYLVMDLVSGRTLEQLLLADGCPGLSEHQVVRWADQVLDVLSYLHSRQEPLIFRDLKPANVMLTPQAQIRLIDFGIARVFTRRTLGTAIGTPGYAPPEQYQGLAEPASDLYALGATMHHLLTGDDPRGRRPFDFPPIGTVLPDLSAHVAAAIDRALVLDPRRRFDTAADMYRALHATTSLYNLPKLTVAGSGLSRAAYGSVLPLPTEATVSVYLGPLLISPGQDIVPLPDQESLVTFGGVTLVASPDRHLIELHNHTDERMPCALISTVPWLAFAVESAWLDAHGMLELPLSVAPSASHGHTPGVQHLPATASAAIPMYLQVLGASPPARALRLNMVQGFGPAAVFCVSTPGSILLLSALHLHLLFVLLVNLCVATFLALRIQHRRRARP